MPPKNIFEQFIASAHQHPNAIAIIDSKSSVTYQQLLEKVENIAMQLYDLECRREEIIPIISNGGVDMVAGMLACLQVAATFVPIDISAPFERTIQMLEDLGSRTAITDTNSSIDHILINELNIIRPNPNLTCKYKRLLNNESIIYGFFTSGSTGKPKCSLNTHIELANRFKFNSSVKKLGLHDVIMQNSKHTFAPVLWQTLWPLTLNATVVIPNRDGMLDIEKTIDNIANYNVVMTDIVPSVLSLLLDYLERNPDKVFKLESLTELFIEGEETPLQLLKRVRKLLPWVRLTNIYGPTEADIGMIYHHVDGTETSAIPLGIPIPGTIAIVLNQELELAKDDEIGQLAIGGACLSKGYYNEHAKTDSVFKSIKLIDSIEKIFLTGDRAVIKNGLIYFRGSTDKQIKIKGVRVELKEIEYTFEKHPEVIQFRVVPVFQKNKETTIVSFFTATKELTSKDLRLFAKQKLPREFIPATFNQISEFMTTTSGEIDHSAIIEMADFITNNTVKERSEGLLELIQYITGISLQSDENFFDAGLDSLSAVRLLLKIEDKFLVKISISQLYNNPTIEALQNIIQNKSDQCIKKNTALSKWRETATPPKKFAKKSY